MEEAQNVLEEVFRVAPVPEDYMKYQLHLSTGMEVPQIEQWFQTRRSSEGSTQLPLEGSSDWASMQRPAIQITSGAERLPSHSGQRRPGRPDLAQPLKALQAGARSNSGDALLARRSSQGALLPAEEPGRVSEQSPRLRDADTDRDRMQPFPFPELHSESHPGSSRHEALQESQLAGLPNLDWLSENPASDARGRPGGNSPSAARQPSGALIDSIGDPAELLSQPNAPFLLSFLSSREDDSRPATRKETISGASGGFKAPAAPGEQQALRHQRSSGSDQLQVRSADRPPTTPGGVCQSPSPRLAQQHYQQQQKQQQQQQRLEALEARPWRALASSSAPMLDCRDVLPPESSEPEWHGQMLTTLGGSMPVSATRQWRQNWGHLGSQGYDQDMVYGISMTNSMDSSRDAFSMRHSEASQQGPCLQMDELERGQILERGTVSLPSMHNNFRQELLKAPPFALPSSGDLATWRRPGHIASGEAPAFIPSPNKVPSQEHEAPPPASSLDNRSSGPTPLPEGAKKGDAPVRRAAAGTGGLPRSISDISETHSLQAYASLRDHGSATDASLVVEDAPAGEPEADVVSEARFVEEDLECVKGLIGLQTITSLQEYDGSKQLFLFEQLTHLDSLDIDTGEPHPSKRRRVRHQHFWRNSDKLPPDHRLYVASADIKQALEEAEPVHGRRQIMSAERTNMWSVCLTSKGVLNYLNRRISPVGVRLFRASFRQAKGGSAGQGLLEKPSLPPMLAPRPKPLPSPAAAVAAAAAHEHQPDEDTPAAGTRKRRSRFRRDSPSK